ncbi:MAG: glycosyltransferase family protein [bacterium]
MRLLYLPNEPVPGWQVGARAALEQLRRQGVLSDLRIYSFLQPPPARALDEILALCEEAAPDAVLFTKVSDFPVDDRWLNAIRRVPSKPLLVYYDGDIYGRVFKRPTAETRTMCRHADLVLACGLGANARQLEAAGARRIGYLPHNASLSQFGAAWTPTATRERDVILIGNRIRGRIALQERIPWARMPGVFEREQLVRRLGAAFRARFAVYGTGWDGFVGNRGPIAFARQHEVLRDSWLSVGYDHFPGTPMYFSDRLPIALLSGVTHAVHYHPGYESLFQSGRELLWAHSVAELVEVARNALGRGPAYLDEIGARGRAFVQTRLSTEVVFADALATIAQLRSGASSVAASGSLPR